MTKDLYNMADVSGKSSHDRRRLFFRHSQMDSITTYILYITLLTMLCVFVNPGLQIITGPVLTCCFSWLYFNKYEPFVIGCIITANDALGCILFGKISFQYLLIAFLIISLIRNKFKVKIKWKSILSLAVILMLLIMMIFHGNINARSMTYVLLYVFALMSIMDDKTKLEMLFKGVAIAAFLIAMHACITGGVEYYEIDENSKEFLRRGVLGVGNGDSNFSSLLLNIGIVCTVFDKDFHPIIKLVILGTLVSAMTITLSATGIIGIAVIIVSLIITNRDAVLKRIKLIVLIAALLFAVIAGYLSLPDDIKSETVEAYIERIGEKFELLDSGDIRGFTTKRSSLLENKFNYFSKEQGFFGMLFGFNSLNAGGGTVTHNTYMDLLLQIGILGTSIVVIYSVSRLIIAWKNPNHSRRDILLKLLFMYYFLTLSIYDGSMFAFSYLVLIAI